MNQNDYNIEEQEVEVYPFKFKLTAHKDYGLKTKPWRVVHPFRDGEASIEGKGATADEAFKDWVEKAKIVG